MDEADIPDLAEFEGAEDEVSISKIWIGNRQGDSILNLTIQLQDVVTQQPGASGSTSNDTPTVIPAAAPPSYEESNKQQEQQAAIPLPPPDETTALNQGDKVAYSNGTASGKDQD